MHAGSENASMTPALSPASLSVRHYGAAPGRHVHDHFQVLWSLDGVLELEVDGRGLALAAGNGLVLRPGEWHDFESRQGSRCLVLDTADAAWHQRPTRAHHPEALHHLAHYLAQALPQALVPSELGASLLARTWGTAPAPGTRPRRDVDWVALSRWVQARLHQPLTAATLAAQVHLSESQFRSRCLQATGCSPMAWVRQQRLLQAQALRLAGLPAAQVARRTGYATPSALAAALRAQSRTPTPVPPPIQAPQPAFGNT